jgi:ethanolaminephosphotransferase
VFEDEADGVALLTFYTQTWEEYHTKTLTLGIVSGPVEGILTLCTVYACTAYAGGGSFWSKSMLAQFGIPQLGAIPDAIYNLGFREWYMVYGGIMVVFNTISRYVSKHTTSLIPTHFS